MRRHQQKSSSSRAGPSQRQLRVGEQLRHVIASVLQRGDFDSEVLLEESRNVSVSEVRPSPDLKSATAYVITLGGRHTDEIVAALNDEHKVFQKEFSRQLNLKFTPRIKFVYDDSFDEAQKIEDILRNL